jgi:hypothetical protein
VFGADVRKGENVDVRKWGKLKKKKNIEID